MKKIKFFILSLMMLAYANVFAQNAASVIDAMGPGFNLGNVWDNGQKTATYAAVKPIIDKYVSEGMTNVRIPTSWMESVNGSTLADANGNLTTTNSRFTELVTTINYCLSKGLYVTLNTHHEKWLKDNYNGTTYYDTKFYTLWYNIANYFKSYSSKLVFEILNEPEAKMGQWGTAVSPLDATAIALTRQIMEVGYNAIRATGGNNTTRVVMVSPNGQANDSQIEEVFPNVGTLPGDGNDQYLAMHVHSYDPWNFCGQEGYSYNNPGATQIIADITTCKNHANNNLGGIPVHYGEFGVGRDGAAGREQSTRSEQVVLDYYKTFAETAIANNMAFSVWDDRGWFALIDDAGSAFTYNIVPYMMTNIENTTPPTTPIALPGTLQAEDYTAYNNADNTLMRVTTTDAGGGTKMGYNSVGDWYDYSVNVATAGTYAVTFRVANGGTTTGQFQLLSGANVLATVSVAPTTGWDVFNTLTANVTLAAGTQTLRIYTAAAGVDYNWFGFAQTVVCSPTALTAYSQINGGTWLQTATSTLDAGGSIALGPQPETGGTWSWTGPNGFTATTREITLSNIQTTQAGNYVASFTNTCGTVSSITNVITVNAVVVAKAIPGVVQAEDYTTYYNAENTLMRVTTTDAGGGTKMGYNSVGDWYNYSVNVATAGTYTVTFRVANGLTTNGQFQLKNGTTVLSTVDVAPTGGWDTFVTLTKTVTLTAGAQTLTLATVVAGVDYNWMEFAQATPVLTTIAFTTSPATTTAGTNATFVAKGYDQFGAVMTSTITYSVSAGATITTAGVFASTAVGTYTVTAASGTVTKTATITVSAGAVNTITVTAALASITSGLAQQYSAVAKDAYNNTVTTNFTWAVTGGGTISATGLFTATTVGGPFNVTATSGTKTGTTTVTVTAAAATGIAIPGTVQAEDYTAYYNVQNTQMRVTTTDTGGGTKMGYNDAGDWYEYSVNVATAGSYTVTFRVANGSTATGQFQLKKGTTVLTTVDVAPTGGWDTFVTLTKTVSFTATGTQTISLAIVTAGVDINWFNAALVTTPVTNSVAFAPSMVVESGDTYTVAVTYSSTTANDVNVGFYTAAWGWVAGQTITVAAGSGVLNFTITIPAATAAGTTYTWQTQIMPVGGTYLQRYAVVEKFNVQVTNLKSSSLSVVGSENEELVLYPSPVSDILYFKGIEDFTKVEIINSVGQLVNSIAIDDAAGFSINMSELKSGMYFVKLINAVETQTKRIMKK